MTAGKATENASIKDDSGQALLHQQLHLQTLPPPAVVKRNIPIRNQKRNPKTRSTNQAT